MTPNITLLPPSAGEMKLKSVKIAMSATVVRLSAGHIRGENSSGSRYIVKDLIRDICPKILLTTFSVLHL